MSTISFSFLSGDHQSVKGISIYGPDSMFCNTADLYLWAFRRESHPPSLPLGSDSSSPHCHGNYDKPECRRVALVVTGRGRSPPGPMPELK